ncbi:MAG TPA: MarR family transcriptional regulator [Acidimicrobiales bacterium]|jgi:MarR family transcriptional regulator for hemolysin
MFPSVPDDRLTRRIVFLGKELREYFQAALVDHGATIPTWAVLSHAHHAPGLSQVQLAGRIGIEGPTLARHLDRLCAEGLVERRRDTQDRRVVRIELTEEGERRWAELKDVADRMEQHLTRYLDDDQATALAATLDAVHRALEDANVPALANR